MDPRAWLGSEAVWPKCHLGFALQEMHHSRRRGRMFGEFLPSAEIEDDRLESLILMHGVTERAVGWQL